MYNNTNAAANQNGNQGETRNAFPSKFTICRAVNDKNGQLYVHVSMEAKVAQVRNNGLRQVTTSNGQTSVFSFNTPVVGASEKIAKYFASQQSGVPHDRDITAAEIPVSNDGTTWVEVSLWGKGAERLDKIMAKKTDTTTITLYVDGILSIEKTNGKDGREYTNVRVRGFNDYAVKFVDRSNNNAAAGNNNAPAPAAYTQQAPAYAQPYQQQAPAAPAQAPQYAQQPAQAAPAQYAPVYQPQAQAAPAAPAAPQYAAYQPAPAAAAPQQPAAQQYQGYSVTPKGNGFAEIEEEDAYLPF